MLTMIADEELRDRCSRRSSQGEPVERSHGAFHQRPAWPGKPDGGPSDAELLHQHVAGDPDAFGKLFHRHRDRLWAVAVRTLGDPEEAADALQDAIIAAFRRARSFRATRRSQPGCTGSW